MILDRQLLEAGGELIAQQKRLSGLNGKPFHMGLKEDYFFSSPLFLINSTTTGVATNNEE